MELNLLLSILVALSIFVLFFGLNRGWAERATNLELRLGSYTSRRVKLSPNALTGPGKAKSGRLGNLLVGNSSTQIATELARADLKITPGEYATFTLLSAALAFLLGFLLLHNNIVLSAVFAFVGFFFPRNYVRFLQGRRLHAFDAQLGDTIVLLSNSLRSGYSLLQSMETASTELPAPMSVEFTRVTREIGLGLSTEEAFANLLRRIPSPDLDLLITAINVQREVGGNLADILDTIAFTIRERIRIVGEIRSITAQQRVSSYILTALPVLLGIVLYILNPAYISNLWSDVCGWMMMGLSVVMIVAGFFIIQKIVSIEV